MSFQSVKDSQKILSDLTKAYERVLKEIDKIHNPRVKIKFGSDNFFKKFLWGILKRDVNFSTKISRHKKLRLEILLKLSKDLYIAISFVQEGKEFDKNRLITLIRIADDYT